MRHGKWVLLLGGLSASACADVLDFQSYQFGAAGAAGAGASAEGLGGSSNTAGTSAAGGAAAHAGSSGATSTGGTGHAGTGQGGTGHGGTGQAGAGHSNGGQNQGGASVGGQGVGGQGVGGQVVGPGPGAGGASAGGQGGDAGGASGSTDAGGMGTAGDTSSSGSGGAPDPCATVKCSANATCTNGVCACDSGFMMSSTGCVPVDPCAGVDCPAGQTCSAGTCSCDPTSTTFAAACWPTTPNGPAMHTQADVCGAWKAGHAISDMNPWSAGAGMCDAGKLSAAGIADTMNRLAMFRWMVGESPTTDDGMHDAQEQACSVLASWNPPGTTGVPDPHDPPPTAECYTAAGAMGTGSSNLAWGSGHPAQAIDQYVEDNGNATTYGHRRWVLFPSLGPVGVGYYAGGGPYGNAQCLYVFGSGTTSPKLPYYTWPPEGFVPLEAATWNWTYHSSAGVGSAPSMTVKRMSDGMSLGMTTANLSQGYGDDAVAFTFNGWMPAAGETYEVTVSGVPNGPVSYTVSPVSCP